MEYISTKEFLKQPKEVQMAFNEWWKPSESDIISIPDLDVNGHRYNTLIEYYEYNGKEVISTIDGREVLKSQAINVLTEGEIRKFIEEKTGCKLFIEYYNGSDILIRLMKANKEVKSYMFYNCNDLLQAYWKVACEIAKREV